MSNDVAIGPVMRLPTGGFIASKPSYLISIEEIVLKTKKITYFITLDKPELLNGFIQVKGMFADSALTEDEIVTKFSELLTSAKKELFLEMFFPWHKICSIRSLVFKAK
jgi:hypothetical protein